MSMNQRTVTVKVTRKELIDILLLMDSYDFPSGSEYAALSEKLRDQLGTFDLKALYKEDKKRGSI